VELEAKMLVLREILLESSPSPSVRTDSSILVVYPPEEENDFRQHLQRLLDLLRARNVPFRHVDLATLPFEVLEARGLAPEVFHQEFDDFQAVKRGLARAIHDALKERISQVAAEIPAGAVILSATAALYPLVKLSDLLAELRHLPCRIVVAFPGREEGGKLRFMNQRDGYNYLAVKIN